MFDMQKVGKRIAEYRKKIDMTQMELADRMNISFQAISNWERGLSMPDISKLPELATIFGITIDELLEEKSDFIQSVVNDKIETYLEQKECSAEEIGQAIPLLKPSQIDAVVEQVQTNSNISIAALLPYMDEDGVKELALQALAGGESVNAYLPFMDEDDIKDLALQVHSRGESITAFLEFMDEDGVKELALQALARGESVNAYLPYMDEDGVKELALKILRS
ncbi:MAG: helix-turn-helix transcriptional regulator [Clostridia bacterium]|nr:helix-turn-helix transcriptional regulator [Clostridia bacterium]